MSKKIIIALVIILVLTGMVYIILPATIKISASTGIKCTISEFNTCVHNTDKWRQWFPGNDLSQNKKDTFYYQHYSYFPNQKLSNGSEILIGEKLKLPSQLIAFNINPDSILVSWTASLNVGNNPMKKIQYYFNAVSLQTKMQLILDSLKHYTSSTINVYGFNIQMET